MDIFIGSLKSKFESPRQWKLYQRYWDIYKAKQDNMEMHRKTFQMSILWSSLSRMNKKILKKATGKYHMTETIKTTRLIDPPSPYTFSNVRSLVPKDCWL